MTTYLRPRSILFALFLLTALTPLFSHSQERHKEKTDSAKTLTFARYPQRFNGRTPLTPNVKLLLRFNAEVDAESVADHFVFFNDTKETVTKIPVKSHRPSVGEIRAYGSYLFRSNLTASTATSLRNHFAIIEPATNLTTGFKWLLQSKAGLTSFSQKYRFKKNGHVEIGGLYDLVISSVGTTNPYDQDMTVYIGHNKYQLAKSFDAEKLAKYISIEPKPSGFKISTESYGIRLLGDFEYDQNYDIAIEPNLIANDTTTSQKRFQKHVTFHPNRGFVRLPSYSETQNASGHRSFDMETANLKAVRTRVKSLKNDNLIFALKGYKDGYKGTGGARTIPFSMVPGKTIFDQSTKPTAGLDITEKISLSWNKLDPSSKHGAYYVSVGGDSKTESGTTFGTHALIQVTDIGMAWKQTNSETLIYAFSIKDGSPKSGIPIRLVSDEGEEVVATKTNEDGIARFPASKYKDSKLWLDATTSNDRHVMPFSKRLNTVGLWSFNIPYRYSRETENQRRTLIFTDRDVYKPGDTVYLKCISRTTSNDSLLPAKPCQAMFKITDGRGRKLVNKQVTFSANGTFNDQFTIPELGLGYHNIEIDFNQPDEDQDWGRISRHHFTVAEYRVNTFEVNMKTEDTLAKSIVSVPLSAKYYMGKPLSKAIVKWNAYFRNEYPRPEGFREFKFGNKYQSNNGNSVNEEIRLSQNGDTTIELEILANNESPAPRHVSLRAEVTDVNQQTISEHTSFTVHSSDFYTGIRKPEGIFRAGDTVPFAIANVDTKGNIYNKPVKTTITVEKEVWTTVKVKGSDGKVTHRNEKHHDLKSQETVEITASTDADSSLPLAQTHSLKFDEAGDYVITLESTDPNGRPVLTKQSFRIIGADEPAWAWNDVIAIDLIPDRKTYRIGDTAKLLVRSPVFGKALVTTERGDVKTTRIVNISKHETIIEVPIEHGAAPNIFASILIVRGSDQSPHKHPTADYRLGYCQLDIEDPANALNITLTTGDEKYYIPGQPVEVAALITDSEGQGVAGAEVTLFAVDEGILSLSGYHTPDPEEVFNRPFPLTVMMGQSLSKLLPENPLEREFGNKGFVIGGGGMDTEQTGNLGKIRKDFKALAFWKPELVTDKTGRVTYTFTAPDNLTSFRLMAVVTKGNTFASADKPVVINKPIIIEPAIPSFSNLSDQIDLTAVLHNNTDTPQDLEITVELDEHAVFIKRLGHVIPTNLVDLSGELTKQVKQLTIAPGQTEVVHLPVAMIKTGDTKWNWKVKSLSNSDLLDSTQSTIQVRFPLPVLKSSHNYSITDSDDVENLLSNVQPRLLNGHGEIEITVSNSRMIEATDALEYLLQYPYGCIEQTTSTTLPWLSTENMRKALPSLNIDEAEIDRAVKKGTSRLLSMQTSDGGLSYWPGGRSSVLWGSAYGGLALAIADKNGTELPQDSLGKLWRYLSKNLRNTAKLNEAYDLSQRCLSVYTLALAGKPEPSYLDVLYNKRDQLPVEAKALLALAIMESNSDPAIPDQRVESLLTGKSGKAESKVSWYRSPYLKATELMAWTKFRANAEKTDQLLDELMELHKPNRGWGSTYSNAWPLMALAIHSDSRDASTTENKVTVEFGGQTKEISFNGAIGSSTLKFAIDGDFTKQMMTLTTSDSGTVYANVKVATQPELLPMKAKNQGFDISRTYQKLDTEGNLGPTENLVVGDLVLVQLDVELPDPNDRYIAIDDPLPSILESINPNFKTQKTQRVKRTKIKDPDGPRYLYTNYRELRKDRTLFFANHVTRSGKYRIQYLTRVIAPGNSIAPPAKIEAMYSPDRYGLSDTQVLSARTLGFKEQQVALR